MSMIQFRYHDAFARNLGWLRAEEQESLRARRVAIAGMGGVGGNHLLALARLGVGAFTIADLDRFDLPNLNRQGGAFLSTMGKPKAETLAAMARDINPELRFRVFPEGVTPANLTPSLTAPTFSWMDSTSLRWISGGARSPAAASLASRRSRQHPSAWASACSPSCRAA